MFFLSFPLLTEIERLTRQKINPLIFGSDQNGQNYDPKKEYSINIIYNAISWLLTMLSINYVAQMFHVQSWDNCYRVLCSYYNIPHILLILVYIVLKCLPKPKPWIGTRNLHEKKGL